LLVVHTVKHRPLRLSRRERRERLFSRFFERKNREKHQLYEHDVGDDSIAPSLNSTVDVEQNA